MFLRVVTAMAAAVIEDKKNIKKLMRKDYKKYALRIFYIIGKFAKWRTLE